MTGQFDRHEVGVAVDDKRGDAQSLEPVEQVVFVRFPRLLVEVALDRSRGDDALLGGAPSQPRDQVVEELGPLNCRREVDAVVRGVGGDVAAQVAGIGRERRHRIGLLG